MAPIEKNLFIFSVANPEALPLEQFYFGENSAANHVSFITGNTTASSNGLPFPTRLSKQTSAHDRQQLIQSAWERWRENFIGYKFLNVIASYHYTAADHERPINKYFNDFTFTQYLPRLSRIFNRIKKPLT